MIFFYFIYNKNVIKKMEVYIMERVSKSITIMDFNVDVIENYPNVAACKELPFSFRLEGMISSLDSMFNLTRREISNLFTSEEALALCHALSGKSIDASVSVKRILFYVFSDACTYDKIHEKWDINRDHLLTKVHNLTEFQAYTVVLLAAKFDTEKDNEKDLKAYVSSLFYIGDEYK